MQLGPKGVGEILSDSVALLRRHFKAFVLAALPICVLELMCREGAGALLSEFTRTVDPNNPEAVPDFAAFTWHFVGYFALMTATFGTSALLYAVGVSGAVGSLFGQSFTPAQMLQAGLKKAVPILVSAFLFWALMMLALAIPGAAATAVIIAVPELWVAGAAVTVFGIYAVVITLFLFLRWFLYAHVVIVEGKWGPAALKRAAQLTSSHGLPFSQAPRLRLSLLLLVFFGASSAVQSLFAIPMLVHGLGQTPPMSDVSLWSMPLLMGVPVGILQVATNAILYPFSAIMTALFYFDLRVRFEGFDLDDDDDDDDEA
jgi:hypothetical protein